MSRGMCSHCGKPVANPDATLCDACKQERKRKAKEWLITAGKVVGIVASVAGAAYLASKSSDDETVSNFVPLPDESNDDNRGLSMSRFKIIMDGEKQDEVFDTEEQAEEYALYLCSCARTGAEMLHWSNPGDYDYDEETFEDPEYEIIEEE